MLLFLPMNENFLICIGKQSICITKERSIQEISYGHSIYWDGFVNNRRFRSIIDKSRYIWPDKFPGKKNGQIAWSPDGEIARLTFQDTQYVLHKISLG